MPLPKGTVRVYKADADGGRQFIGEDRIDHTPKDEMLRIKMGEAFDMSPSANRPTGKKSPMTSTKPPLKLACAITKTSR